MVPPPEGAMLSLILALTLALLLSAVFTVAEVALFSLGEGRVRGLVDDERPGSRSLVRLRTHPERLLILLRLGDSLADVTAGATAAYIAYLEWQLLGLAIAIVLIALTILFFGELVPIAIGTKYAVPIALVLAPILLWVSRLLKLPLIALERMAGVVPERGPTAAAVMETEIRELTVLGHTEGVIKEHERQLIERAFRLDEMKAWEVMTPRVDIFAWQDSLTLAEIAPQLPAVLFSRIPVYDETIDNITGVLYLRDAHQALISGLRDVPLRQLARDPLVVPGSVSLTRLLKEFQTRRIHMAIVMDEYGGTDGLVTLEDVLEELVGEIADELEGPEEPQVVRVSRNEVLAQGEADLREINHIFNTALPQLEHRSLNGYLLEEFGRVPETGERLERDGIALEVLEATETQVLRVRLQRQGTASGEGADETEGVAAQEA